jgi:hypothetical protein
MAAVPIRTGALAELARPVDAAPPAPPTRPGHVHTWEQRYHHPKRGIFAGLRIASLCCADCGVLWPGEPLPEPVHDHDGYGHVAEQPGFNARLRAALADIPDLPPAA